MAMTNALNYVVEKYISEFHLYQMVKHTVSSPQPLRSVNEYQQRPVTTREQLMLIYAFFGFSKSRLGEIFGVSRQSVYNWFNDVEPVNEHYGKIRRLADIAYNVDPKPSQPIFHIYVNDVVKGYDKSLYDYLCDDDFDMETVVKLSRTIYEMSKERWKRIDVMPKSEYGQNDPSILEHNLEIFEEEKLGMQNR